MGTNKLNAIRLAKNIETINGMAERQKTIAILFTKMSRLIESESADLLAPNSKR